VKRNFKRALEHVLVHEGGWSDHPRDPGGATMKGVTLRTYQRHFGANRTKRQLRNISDEELQQIYREGYWEKCHCDKLPSGVDYAVFDAAVNSGPGRSAKWLQAAVGAKQDGAIGEKTLAAVADAVPLLLVDDVCDKRLNFLQSLANWSVFGGGWGRRVKGVRITASAMAGGVLEPVEQEPVKFNTVRRGSRGVWVEKLQAVLGLAVDGSFDAETDAALKQWQAENGLVVDGIAGRNTYRAMGLIP